MLQTLKIKNVALTSEATIHFDEKLNIISGETGAGKSVLLDALGLVLGNKADKTLIKHGEEFLKVEATFVNNDSEKIKRFFNDNDLEFDDCIIISRKVSIDNKNEVKLNGQNVPLMYLKTLASMLVDIHGQNDNNEIFNKQYGLFVLDNFVEFDFNKLEEIYACLKEINAKINNLNVDEEQRNREIDLLNYQIEEIENANISENEENDLKNELILIKNAEKISISLNKLKENHEGSIGIFNLIRKSVLELSNIVSLGQNCQDLLDRYESLEIELSDIYDEITKRFDLGFSEDRLEEIDNRLDVYKTLHKKYGLFFEDIQNFLNSSKARRDQLLNFENELNLLNKQKSNILSTAFEFSTTLTDKRKQQAKILQEKLVCELKELCMPNAKVEFSFNEYDKDNFEQHFTKNGADQVEIMFSANLGENVKPLSLVASGGEISRFMLALKTITSENDETPTIIFDELDTGISGEASVSTSKKLAKMSRYHQILAVSHQFQICAMADKNILIKKTEENGKTLSMPIELGGEETVKELCRFLSVDKVTESTILHAKEVKLFCDNYKKNL